MLSEEKLNEIFKDYDNLSAGEAIQRAMKGREYSYNTAKKYYYEWRNEYMANQVPTVEERGTRPKKESTAPKKLIKEANLDVKEIRINGSNGTYRVCKDGIELKNEEQILSFENLQQWEDFKAEIDKVFEYGKSNKILA